MNEETQEASAQWPSVLYTRAAEIGVADTPKSDTGSLDNDNRIRLML